ncbi:hypothetical protein Slin15195_G029140 [Septoria linicola]|uniref:Uncharacterized protein n=1 Tax=Septoria linicola TaxID=215465 RepID=A0A9Q9AIB7_9PEZI|nr:hypothetical protein Slin14017_G028170 [Septoria linicola]USW49595.1 hypothetical protein Slin15195_G029140 [Septoria linicola]
MAQVMTPSVWPMQARTTTRKQKHNALLNRPLPACASVEFRYEYLRIGWMLRELIALEPLNGPQKWKQDVLAEALRVLHSIDDASGSPAVATRENHARWADVMVRRIVVESLWEDGTTISFYDCCDALRTGRSKAAAARLSQQARTSWAAITIGADFGTEFRLAA